MRGLLIVVSGPSGAGKGTVLKKVLERNENMEVSVSCTTRSPRPGEKEGVNYFFKTHEEFAEMLKNGEFLEYARVFDNYYGTPKGKIEELLDAGKDVVLEIDVQGTVKVKNSVNDAVYIFITPPSIAELKSRLMNRGTETEEQLALRLATSTNELRFACEYDYLVVNDTVEQAVQDIENIIKAERLKIKRTNKAKELLIEGEELL